MADGLVKILAHDEDEDDEEIQLSLSTQAALKEFLSEKNEREERLKQIAESALNADKQLLDEIDLEEDWV
jgi:transposase